MRRAPELVRLQQGKNLARAGELVFELRRWRSGGRFDALLTELML
jgi:hypothetical protein